MTDKEIKAIVYGYNRPLEYYAIEFQMYTGMMTDFLHYLLRNYEIVSKEKIREEYANAKKTHDLYTSATCINNMESRNIDHSLGRMWLLKSLFPQILKSEEK